MPGMSRVAQDGLEWYKQVLEENSSFLMKNLTLNSLFYASLVSRSVLTSQEAQDIEDEQIQSERLWKLVKLLQRKSSRNFSAFLEILRERGQKHIAAKLAADIKHKAKYNDSERCAQENINKYIHEKLGKSTHISITEQKKFTSELVLTTDYQYVNSVNKNLLQEIEELNDDLKEEKHDHQVTKDQLNEMIRQYKLQLEETEKVRQEMDRLKEEFQKSVDKIKELQTEKTALREELERMENMEQTVPKVEETDRSIEEMKQMHQREVNKLSEDVAKMQAKIRQQEKELKAMNNKVYAIMNDLPAEQSDSFDPEQVEYMSAPECLDHILALLHSTENKPKQKASKDKRKEQLKQELEEMTRSIQQKEEQWNKQLQEAKEKERDMAKHIRDYKQDIRKLKKRVEELNTPSPETRGRSDSLTSLNPLNLPQVDMLQRSFMVSQQPQNPARPMRRQASNDTINSLPVFHRPVRVPVPTSYSYTPASYLGPSLQCQVCNKRINRTELMTGVCNHHAGHFNALQQRWQCCQQPKRNPGCRVSKHIPKQ